MFSELVEMVPDHRLISRNQCIAGRAVLTTVDSIGTSRDGRAYEWVLHSLAVFDASGRITTFELFDEDAWDVALARFDELSAMPVDVRTPDVTNLVTRVTRRMVDLANAGRFDEMLDAYRPDFERIDHRGIVAAPPLQRGAAEYMEGFRAYLEVFDRLTVEPVAVRGERLALNWSVVSSDDSLESVFLHVLELDAAGLVVRMAYFDEDDLAAAVAELDERYFAGEGAEHADLLRLFNANVAGVAARDYAGLAGLTSPEFEYVDHRLVSWGTRNRQGFADMRRGDDDLPTTFVATKVYLGSRALIARMFARAAAEDGSALEWLNYCVFVADADGRSLRSEVWDDRDWDAALARFDELAAAASVEPADAARSTTPPCGSSATAYAWPRTAASRSFGPCTTRISCRRVAGASLPFPPGRPRRAGPST